MEIAPSEKENLCEAGALTGRSVSVRPAHVATVGGGRATTTLRGVVDDDAGGEGAELDGQL
eukprot:COSAG06_NODE_2009_length_7850_cov_75.138692_1_plen_61_part_00